MPDAIETRLEETTDARGNFISIHTLESLVSKPSTPSGAKNVRYSVSDGRHVLTYETSSDTDEYTVEASMSQEPIETHEKFKDVTSDEWEKWTKWKNGDESWNPSSGTANIQTLAKWYRKGVTDYLVPRAIVRITKSEGSPPLVTRLGKIQSPPGAPSLPTGANWMLVGTSGNKDASGKWTNTYEYMSSGHKGWDSEIYN